MIKKIYDIIDRSEQAIISLAYKLCNQLKKLARHRNHLTFLMKCRDLKLIPKGFRIHPPVHSFKAKLISQRASRALIRERIQYIRRKKIQLHLDSCTTKFTLRSYIDEPTLTSLVHWAETKAEQEFQAVKLRHKQKLSTLTQERNSQHHSTPSRNVTNLSKRTLDTQEHQVLSLGLNFAFCPTKVPTDDIICRTEQVASLLNSLTTRVADLQLFVTCAKRPELQICNFFTINT